MIKLRTVILLATILRCNLTISMDILSQKITQNPALSFKKSNSIDIPEKNIHYRLKSKLVIAVKIAYKREHLEILTSKLKELSSNYQDNSESKNWIEKLFKIIEILKTDPHGLELQKFNVPRLSELPFDDYIKDL